MATTTNFGWETPDDTDLVKDGAAAIRTALGGVDTSFVDLKGGTTGQVLSKASNTDLDYTWVTTDDANAIQNAIVDAKGDLIAATAADTPARLAVGANDTVLTADSSTATGLKWATSGFPAWTSFTPTVSASSGTITTYSVAARYSLSGKVCVATYQIDLTNVGTASGTLIVTAPFAARTISPTIAFVGSATENNNTGKGGYANLYQGTSNILSRDSDFVTWFSNSNRVAISILYEVA